MAGTTVSFRYWPVAPVPPPRTSILLALEPITSTFLLLITPPVVASFDTKFCSHRFSSRRAALGRSTASFARDAREGRTGPRRWHPPRQRGDRSPPNCR